VGILEKHTLTNAGNYCIVTPIRFISERSTNNHGGNRMNNPNRPINSISILGGEIFIVAVIGLLIIGSRVARRNALVL